MTRPGNGRGAGDSGPGQPVATSRELVLATVEFRNDSGIVPRHLWTLPWAETHYPQELGEIRRDFPDDIVLVPSSSMCYATPVPRQGNWYAEGQYVDEWGCVFENIQAGLIGEVKQPLIPAEDEDWAAASKVHVPEELLTLDIERVNRFCAGTGQFVLAGELVRPFERMQFIRGTEGLFIDIALRNPAMLDFMKRVHDFNCRLLSVWARTNVDGLFFMDDWGSQRSLLVDPAFWIEFVKPMYREYAAIAHAAGKKIFFHSDGFTLDIVPHLVDIGVDAANLQVFCIGPELLEPWRGKITFWGEIDRQKMLVSGTREEIRSAVARARASFWNRGGAIAQCEFGAGASPLAVREVFEAWSTEPA